MSRGKGSYERRKALRKAQRMGSASMVAAVASGDYEKLNDGLECVVCGQPAVLYGYWDDRAGVDVWPDSGFFRRDGREDVIHKRCWSLYERGLGV